MDKAQALQYFWSGFGLDAYDEQTVPKGAQMPYITYSVSTGAIGDILYPTASIWYRDTSWKDVTKKAEQVAEAIGYGFVAIPIDGGYLRIVKGSPFSQRMSDPSDAMIRRIVLNIQAEFLTAY